MVYFSVIMSVILAVMDAQIAGLLTRYFADFAWLFMIAAVMTIFALYENCMENDASRVRIINMTTILSFATMALAFLTVFAHSENGIVASNPVLYHTVEHLIAFWM